MAGKQKLKDIQASADEKQALIDEIEALQESAAEKQELLDEIEELQGVAARQATEIRAHEERERWQAEQKHRAEQQKRRAAEQKERRERINDLAAGKLSLKDAHDWGIVSEGGAIGLQVFVPLDEEEQKVAFGYLSRKDLHKAEFAFPLHVDEDGRIRTVTMTFAQPFDGLRVM